MDNGNEGKVDHDWLRVMYAEAWNQYSHEDNLNQSLNTVFLGAETALLSAIVILIGFFIPKETQIGPVMIKIMSLDIPAWGILWTIAVIIAVFGFLIAGHWINVTKSGHSYILNRWFVTKAIEAKAGLDPVSLGGIENDWYHFSNAVHKKSNDKLSWADMPEEIKKALSQDTQEEITKGIKDRQRYFPFIDFEDLREAPGADQLREISIRLKGKSGAWKSVEAITKLYRMIWVIVGFVGTALVLVSLIIA